MSSDQGAIDLLGVGKRFRRGPMAPTTVKDAVVGRWRRRHRPVPFWALQDVTYRVEPGRTVGIVGRNGAGKSTLLRLIGGIGRPDAGRVVVRGRVGALLELGKDFHPELTGRENVILSAVIAGMTRREAHQVLETIVEFAELQTFIDNPLRTYSTGMQARLAFSTAVHVEPDVLLVDEVLAVGDIDFQQRCIDRLRAFHAAGVTIVLVSHEIGLVRDLCDDVLWLRKGRLAAAGSPEETLRTYIETMSAETEAMTPDGEDVMTEGGTTLQLGSNRFGSQAAQVARVRLVDGWSHAATEVPSGAALAVEVTTHVPESVGRCLLSVKLRRHDDVICVDSSTEVDPPGGAKRLAIGRLDLAPGRYAIDVGLFTPDWERTLDLHLAAYPLLITGAVNGEAVLQPPTVWSDGPS